MMVMWCGELTTTSGAEYIVKLDFFSLFRRFFVYSESADYCGLFPQPTGSAGDGTEYFASCSTAFFI
ncbi:hypothetical protein ANCCAN_14614 [Ancylostoma caninum]|uniref:Uncharacterized protein n=1 Tax=Ancylostoma caninum TaxID=29170 RepID=A0A368G6Z8_ANCCA|nr:hypothetical protein ANCCAN_14614 [Ancylostoma caninum]